MRSTGTSGISKGKDNIASESARVLEVAETVGSFASPMEWKEEDSTDEGVREEVESNDFACRDCESGIVEDDEKDANEDEKDEEAKEDEGVSMSKTAVGELVEPFSVEEFGEIELFNCLDAEDDGTVVEAEAKAGVVVEVEIKVGVEVEAAEAVEAQTESTGVEAVAVERHMDEARKLELWTIVVRAS